MSQHGSAQYATTKVKTKHQAYTDSLKNVEYNYVFPIWGQEAYKQGFDIPYPMGIMTNFLWMDQGIVIDNMQLGLKSDSLDIPMTAIDFIGFGENKNTSYAFNVRPDVWVLPFLNVYGLFGYGTSRTEVNLVAPVALKSIVEQGIRTMGIGVMGAGGIGPVWFSVDANFTWNKPELLDEPTRVNVLGLRFGHTFVNKNRPDRNFAIWAGGMRLKMSTETVGAISMKDALPQETWDRAGEISDNYWDWYNGLDPNKPADAKKIEKADEVLTPIINRIENADGDAVISYGMDKQTKQMWNGVIGMQYQLNKNWQFRTEGGIVGDRKSFLFSVNYRFLGPKKSK
ncbi:MAG: hypothetical protein DRJ05_07705 [Bacteroidetes bacterium]|nr:MAG: hypothetical protein DRJ05_07705 [Bacteroidota bacterium]